MTQMQKIIKYCAIVFAVFLSITIFAAIFSAGWGVLNAVGAINANDDIIYENLTLISDGAEDISSLNIDLNTSELKIETGDSFKVLTNNKKIEYVNENGNISIEEKGKSNWTFSSDKHSQLVIYIPKDKSELKYVEIDLGVGETAIDGLTATEYAKINGGVGELTITSSKINNLDLDVGVGESNIKAELSGNNKIDTGVGEVNLSLTGTEEEYTFDVDKGIGTVMLNGRKLSDDSITGTGSNMIEISGGIGEIEIKTL